MFLFSLLLIGSLCYAKVYDCTKPNPNGKGVIGFLFDPTNTPEKQCSKYTNQASKYNCISTARKVYNENMQSYNNGTCYERRTAIIKYGPGECTVNFMVKDGKAHFLDVRGNSKEMNQYIYKCATFLEETYPKSHPNIYIKN